VAVATLARPVTGQGLPYQGILGYVFLYQSSQSGVISFHYGRQQFYSLAPKRRS
jgi:hypothetical protein